MPVNSRLYPQLGSLVRLHGLLITNIPPTPSDSSVLHALCRDIVLEAAPFIDGVAPRNGSPSLWRIKGPPKTYPASLGTVQLYQYNITRAELRKLTYPDTIQPSSKEETWFCRRSLHQNSAQECTASWAEFVDTFRDYHSESEKAFTPTVLTATTLRSWPVSNHAIIEPDTACEWKCESLKLIEMTHNIKPKPLCDRIFPVLQLVVSRVDIDEFMVVSIPIMYPENTQESRAAKVNNLVVGAYVSIERIRVLPTAEIEWIMATASDAKGVLPQWVQNLAVPEQVAHDVDMFMRWIPRKRKTKAGKNEQEPMA